MTVFALQGTLSTSLHAGFECQIVHIHLDRYKELYEYVAHF